MLTVRSTINIASQTVPPIIPVVQGDTGRAILFTLADFTIPAGATATYYVQKPSGEAVYNNATIDGNNVLVELTAQSIIEKGDNYGQVRITVGEEVVTSFDFILLVKEFRGIDAVQSLTEMNIFDEAVEQAADAIDEVKTDALEAIDDAKDEAIEEVTSNFDLQLNATSIKGVQNQVITQAINTVNNAIGDLSGETVTPTATNNYGVGGNVGQVIETWATTEYWHGIYTVSAGNTYGITTVSDFPQQLVVWFTNASNTIIENHKAFATDHVEMVCTAPTGVTKLFVMSYGYDAYHGTVQKVEPLSETVSNLKEDFDSIVSRKISIALTNDKSITTGYTVGNVAPLTVNNDPGWQSVLAQCSSGDKFEINIFGGVSNRGYVFVDSNNIILAASEYGSINKTVIAPNGAVKLVVNNIVSSHGGTGVVSMITPDGRLDILEDEVNDIKLVTDNIATVSNNDQCNKFFQELFLEGADPSVTYKWYIAARNNPTYGYNVGIAIDGTTTIVAYLFNVQSEPVNPVIIPEYHNSGITGYAVLDWSALESGSNKTYNIPLNESVKDVTNSPVIYSYLHQGADSDILIAMPERINAVVGDTLQLYYQGMFRCVNAYNYAVTLQCDIGAQYPRYYELTPTATNVGEHTLTVQLRDNNGSIISKKNVVINVVSAPTSPVTQKNIFCVGASCTQNGEWVGEFKRKLTEDYSLTNINFIGRMAVNGTRLEATGGYTWSSYTNTNASLLYKFYFNSANLPSVVNVGDVYSSNGHNYTITEINIPTPDGGGYISCTSDGLPGGASGTLTRVSGTGDNTLTYYNYITSGNPFLYNGQINLPQYMTDYCGGVSPDVVYTELFVNGSSPYNNDVSSMMGNMKAFAQMFHTAYPNCKIALGMPYCPDEKGGTGKNYNATGGFSWQYGIKYTFMEYMKTIEEYLSDNGLDAYVTLVNWTNEFDSENDFQQTTKAVNVRSTQTEIFGVNGIHPSNVGYMQMADSAVRHFIANSLQ